MQNINICHLYICFNISLEYQITFSLVHSSPSFELPKLVIVLNLLTPTNPIYYDW